MIVDFPAVNEYVSALVSFDDPGSKIKPCTRASIQQRTCEIIDLNKNKCLYWQYSHCLPCHTVRRAGKAHEQSKKSTLFNGFSLSALLNRVHPGTVESMEVKMSLRIYYPHNGLHQQSNRNLFHYRQDNFKKLVELLEALSWLKLLAQLVSASQPRSIKIINFNSEKVFPK